MTILPTKPKKPQQCQIKDRERQTSAMASGSIERQRQSPGLIRKPKKVPHSDIHGSGMGPGPSKRAHHSSSQSPSHPNSDDEYGGGFKHDQLELEFAERLKASRGLVIKEMNGDGSCLFRSVADQVYGDQEMHGEVRRLCMDYMEHNRDHFSPFITEDFESYIARKRLPACHGNHVELQAISEMYARPVEIYEYSDQPNNIFQPTTTTEINAPIRLSYHGAVHYNSVVDPFSATIGVGLGLPGLIPGAADASLIAEAARQSDVIHLEETMLHDKLHMTDWERTEEDLKDQVARESYMDYVKKMENSRSPSRKSPPRKECCSPKAHSPTQKASNEQHFGSPPRASTSSQSHEDRPSTSSQSQPAGNRPGLYEELLACGGYSEWADGEDDEAAMMAQALLLSQQQFVSDLQARRDSEKPGSSRQ